MTNEPQMGFVQRASRQIDSAVRGIANLVKLEVVVSAICVCIPLILLIAAGWPPRPSISAYYSMTEAQYFYVPLSVAAMLFIVNGVVKEHHWYNVALGLGLITLTLFNHAEHRVLHYTSAVVFFIGNAAVFVIFTPKKELWFKLLLAAVMILALAGHFLFGWYSLFWAESLSLWIIALHFVLEAKGPIK